MWIWCWRRAGNDANGNAAAVDIGGRIAVGYDADFKDVDLKRRETITTAGTPPAAAGRPITAAR